MGFRVGFRNRAGTVKIMWHNPQFSASVAGVTQVALEIGIIKCGIVRVFLETGHQCLTAAFSVGWGG